MSTKQLDASRAYAGVLQKPVQNTWPSTNPVRTVAGKNITPDRGDITGVIGQGFTSLIDLGFAAAGDRLQDAIAGNSGSITGTGGSVIPPGAQSFGGSGSSGLLLLAAGAALLYFVVK